MLPEETIRARWIANPCCGYSNRGINPYKILTPIESISRNLFIRDNLIPTFCFHWNPCMNLFVSRKLFSFLKKRERRGRRRKKVVPRYDHANLPCWSLPNLRIIHIEIREEIFSISLWWKHRTTHQFVNRLQTSLVWDIVDKNLSESFLRHSFTLFRTLWGRPHELNYTK